MTLPCGTPDLTLRKDEETPSITIRCFLIMEIISEPVKKLTGNSKRF
jgi:hypothetical protein